MSGRPTLPSALAARTIVTRASGDHHAANRRAAAAARLAAARVHVSLVLIAAVGAVWLHVVADAGAAGRDRTAHHFLHGAHDRLALGGADARGAARRAYAREVERLVRVDVADAGDHTLLQQQRFDRNRARAGRVV